MAMTEDEKAVQGIKDPKARKAAYYTRQRQNASAGSATQKKIQSKLNFGDEVRGFAKDQLGKIMSSGPYSIPGERAASAGADVAESAMSRMVPHTGEESASKSLVPERSTSYQHLGRATPVKKALPSNKRALGSSEGPPKLGSKSKGPALGSSKGPKAVGGPKRKAISTSKESDYAAELGTQTKRSKIPGGKKGAVKGSRKKKTGV